MADANRGLLHDARVYLSGPMDFVASRAVEKATGWRNRVGQFLASFGVTVFDPWEKPEVRGLKEYGKEGEGTTDVRRGWTYKGGEQGARERAEIADGFWPALHIDLRMVDASDFIICFCPTNIYSVGTPHEIIVARQERKPVLFVSPYVSFSKLGELREHLKSDPTGLTLLEQLAAEVPIKENLNASPSLWYMPLIGGEHFFDGFGFAEYRGRFGWPEIALDANERAHPPHRPLLPFIEDANKELPKKWDRHAGCFATNDDWLLWDLRKREGGGAVEGPRQHETRMKG
jgi:hypothetical protein